MPAEEPAVAAYIGRWRPSSVSPQAAAFAQDVIARVAPAGRERAKNLLWAAGKLADYAASLGLELTPGVVLHPSVTERFTRCAPGLSSVARRTLRTNLRFIGRRVVPQFYPADVPLPRERYKAPYSRAEIARYPPISAGAVQGALQPRGDRRVPGAGGRPAHDGAADARGRTGLPRGGGRADPRRPARRARHRRGLPVRAAGISPTRWSARWTAGRACPGWIPPGCARPGWPNARGCSAWPRSWQRPGSAARSGSVIWSPAWNPAARTRPSGCSGPPGDDRAAGVRGGHRRLWRRGPDRCPARGLGAGGTQRRQPVAGRGLDGPGILLPAPAARHQRLR